MQTLLKIGLTAVVASVIFGAGMLFGYGLHIILLDDQPAIEAEEEFSLYWEVWNRVDEQFYGGVPTTTNVTYSAIRGSLSALEDPYTVFLEPEPAAKEKAQLEGQFGGIGAYVQQTEAGDIVLDPMREQAAEKAGLQTGDILIGIDGRPVTSEMTIDDVVNLIRGEVGTEVVLTLLREGSDEPLELPVVRAIIETPSADWHILEQASNIGYIRLTSFTERSNDELLQAFEELQAAGADSFILDLRGNGGGLLDAAINISSQFLDEGVVLREDRQNEGDRTYDVRSSSRKILEQPLVLLIDGGTASASEIVAGALQDYDRATLIGEKTFGKGSVQLIYELSDRSRLHVTVAKWFTPNGNLLDGVGLQPDIEVLFSEEDHATGRDPQLERAVEFLQNETDATAERND